jgi:hypothetical protein
MCFNADRKTLGSFGVIYHRDTFSNIVSWTEAQQKPFDHIFADLALQGFPVRAAYPNLVIQDVSHKSSVDPDRKAQEDVSKRAKLHRWDLDSFCKP